MWIVRTAMLMAAVSVVSGCAGVRTRQDLARLQSQVGLLDERVSQLERAGLGSASAPSLSETAADVGSTTGFSGSSQKSASVTVKTGAAASTKPTTREIQQALKNAGFYQGAVDGKMGAQTREAIKEFQRVHGLVDDGAVGKQTWGKLRSYAELSSGSGELNAAEILK